MIMKNVQKKTVLILNRNSESSNFLKSQITEFEVIFIVLNLEKSFSSSYIWIFTHVEKISKQEKIAPRNNIFDMGDWYDTLSGSSERKNQDHNLFWVINWWYSWTQTSPISSQGKWCNLKIKDFRSKNDLLTLYVL